MNSTLYVIGDYLYSKFKFGEFVNGKMLDIRCRHYRAPCKAKATLEQDTLRIIEVRGKHSCVKDPGLKYQVQMKSEMEELAETTNKSFKEIFFEVCAKYAPNAPKISFDKMSAAMSKKRKTAISILMCWTWNQERSLKDWVSVISCFIPSHSWLSAGGAAGLGRQNKTKNDVHATWSCYWKICRNKWRKPRSIDTEN